LVLGLVVAGGVEDELADECAGVVEDADVASGDEDGDGLAGVASAESDVVEPSFVSDGDFTVAVDFVAAEAVAVDGDAGESWVGFGARVERGDGGLSVERAVGSVGVVGVDELVELVLERSDRGGRVLFGEELLLGLVEPFDLPAGLRVVGP
jgi:hypothetical protein